MSSDVRQGAKVGLLIVLSLTLMFGVLLAGCAKAPTAVEKVKVGLSLGYTGAFASGTAPVSDGILAYMKYVNDQGGIQYTDPTTHATQKALLDIDWEDNAYDVSQTLSVYETQKQWGMDLEELVMSPDVLAADASRDEIPVLGAGNLDAASLAPQPDYTTACYGSYVDQVLAFTEWASHQQATPPRIAWIALDIPGFMSAAGGAGMTDALMSQYGGRFVDREVVESTATDMTIEMTRIKAANPDYVILQLIPGTIALALHDAQMVGMPSSVKFVAITVFGEGIIPIVGNQTQPFYGLTCWSYGTEGNVTGVQFADRVMDTYYGHPATTDNVWGVMLGMVGVGAIQKALDTVGYAKLTPTAVNDALQNLTNFDTMGITPPVTMTPSFPAISDSIKIGVIQNGQLRAISGWIPMPRVGITLK